MNNKKWFSCHTQKSSGSWSIQPFCDMKWEYARIFELKTPSAFFICRIPLAFTESKWVHIIRIILHVLFPVYSFPGNYCIIWILNLILQIMWYCPVCAVCDIFITRHIRISNETDTPFHAKTAGDILYLKMPAYYHIYSYLISRQDIFSPVNHCIMQFLNIYLSYDNLELCFVSNIWNI